MTSAHPDAPFDPFAGPAIVATAPTTESQREIWTACALGDDASLAYNESLSLVLAGSLNRAEFCAAFDEAVARHDALRSTLSADGLTLMVGDPAPGSLQFSDWSDADLATQRTRQAAASLSEVTTPFDLVRGPLYRAQLIKLAEQQHQLRFTAHHIVFDGWSGGVFVADLAALYARRLRGGAPLAPGLSFADYAREQAASPGEERPADERYWLQRFAGQPMNVDLPSDRPRPPLKTFCASRCDLELSAELAGELRRVGASLRASLFVTLFGAFNALVHRLSQQEDVVIGIPAAGQALGDYASLVGHCVNMLPIRNAVRSDQPFAEFLAQVRANVLDAQEHQGLAFGKLLTKLPLTRDPSRLPLISVIFNVDRALAAEAAQFPELTASLSGNPRAYENFELFLNAVEIDGRIRLECQYNTDLFDAATIQRWLGAYEVLLRSIVSDSTQSVGSLDLLADSERAQLAAWLHTDAEFPESLCVHELIARAVAATPEAIACEFEGQTLSYAELERRAAEFARTLRSVGVGRGTLVGLCVERSPLLIIGALAIWKAGGAYVPMDPGYPRERLVQMLEDSAAPVLVTEARVNQELGLQGAKLAFVDEVAQVPASGQLAPEQAGATPEDVAYVIYTSGSTGKPKGVLVPHRAVVNLLSSVAKQPGLVSSDVVLAVTTLSFDIAVSEIWLPLSVGAKIVLVSRETAADGALLRDVVEKRQVTFIDATPASYRLLLGAGWSGGPTLKLICTGEAMPLELARQLKNCSGSLWNGYGPTETTVWSTFWQVPAQFSRVLIGRAVDNTRIYVLDERRRPVPINVPGELYIAGAGVSQGYLNRPELTRERFVDDPSVAGQRMYRTGDLGRYLPSGELECMGRNDNQVKLRGFRIELGEIESALGQHPAVGEVAVIRREDRPGDPKLVAYFVVTAELPSASALRAHLKQTLPDYMIPGNFVALQRMPLTPSGKIDRRALPAPDSEPVRGEGEFVAPSTPMEGIVADLWSAMLGVGRVSVHDDFFALGGHSLLASQILARLRRDHGVQLSFRKFFEAPTVARLAKECEANAGQAAPVQLPLVRRAPGTPVPLSMAQERIALMEQMHPAQQMSHSLPAAWQMKGPVDLTRLQLSLDVVAQRHETLRSVVSLDGSRLVQEARASLPLPIESRDLRSWPADERRPKMMAEIRERTAVPFELSVGPLFRSVLYQLEDELFVYFTLRHNLIWDGWSYDIFLADLSESYAALAESRPSKLAELPIAYGDYVIWQREWLKSAEISRQRDWWHKELADAPLDLELPYDFRRPARMSFAGGTVIARFSQEQSAALTALAHQANTTLFMLLFAAYAALLHRYTGREDILVGLPVRGRYLPELENLIGSFTNTIVLRAKVDPSHTFLEFLARVRDRALDAFSHEQLPLEMLESRPPIVRALFSFQDARARPLALHNVALDQVDVEPPAAANDLMVWMVERHDHLVAVVNYSSELFHPDTIARLVRGFSTLLAAIVENPRCSVAELNVVHEQDASLASALAGQTAIAANDLPLQTLITNQCRERGDAPAVLQAGESLSYAQLDEQSAALAVALIHAGVKPGDVVALASATSAAKVTAVLGIWRAGGVLLAIDATAPAALVRQLVESSGARLVLDAGALATTESFASALRLSLTDALGAQHEHSMPTPSLDARAWLRVRLDAEGAPRFSGVGQLELLAPARDLAALAGVAPATKLAVGLMPFSDSFALEIALGLATGATLVLPPKDTRPEQVLVDGLKGHDVDVALAPAAAFVELRAAGGKAPPVSIVFGGAPPELLVRLQQEVPGVVSIVSVDAQPFLVQHEQHEQATGAGATGRVLGSVRTAVLDQAGREAPLGVAGALEVEFTAGRRLATGVRARRRASGAIAITSSLTGSLSVSGQRFAQGAVARAVSQHAAVEAAFVAVESAGIEGERVVCYFVLRDGAIFTETELRRQARAVLPAALVPQVFVELSELPRDAAGNLEPARLPSPFAASAVAYVAPRTPSEKLLAKMFMDVLGATHVGVHDNFFDLGGQSLLCLRVIDRIERETRCRLSPRILLLNTLGQAATALDQLQTPARAPETLPKSPEATGVAGRALKGLRGLLGRS